MDAFICDFLTVDYIKGLVFIDKDEVHLTPIEYKLLKLLIANRGKVLTHNYILKQIWGYGEEVADAKNVRVFMASLRRKIEKDTANPRFILTQVGIGYRFVEK
jgi:two-component system KDP operon response regulator KdpE